MAPLSTPKRQQLKVDKMNQCIQLESLIFAYGDNYNEVTHIRILVIH